MQNPFRNIRSEREDYLRYALILLTVFIVTFFIPKKGKFKYEFELGKPWLHEDLAAPFSFPILKDEETLRKEQEETINNFRPFYKRDESVAEKAKERFSDSIAQVSNIEVTREQKQYYTRQGLSMLDEIYERGIIYLDTPHNEKPKTFVITEVRNNVAEDHIIGDYYIKEDLKNSIMTRAGTDSLLKKSFFLQALNRSLDYNVTYDTELSEKHLKELNDNISLTRGMVKQGEKIITKGSDVNKDRYQKLVSLKQEYETKQGQSFLLFIGYFILVGSIFLMYGVNLEIFHDQVSHNTRSIILILSQVVLFTGITAYIVRVSVIDVYLIPYTIVPIVLLAFFGLRIAVITYFLIILVCGLIVPNPYEFLLVQTMAGFTAILSMARVRYISQFFISALLIFMTYCLVYLGFTFIRSGELTEIEWRSFAWFGGNFILCLLAYPLIYANEKIFGFLSDISLLELADINNKLLKELFLRAPGTFQHSLQVANLAEAVIDRIGGNALLTRVGAMYHDVGKLFNPEFFIENQKHSYNPHDQLGDLESAEIIISHVTKGVELANEYNLPKKVTDFIRTHHGTTRVEYFYRHYLEEHRDIDELDDTVFRYPGPKPSSKETAVVMIVDSVEAASRSMKEPDEKQIDNMVDRIIDSKIQDNQFDYATITIQEINATRRILKKLVKSIYHIRIQYPSESDGKKIQQKVFGK
jgi:putative nucleotidyltransferase with HDIG domain